MAETDEQSTTTTTTVDGGESTTTTTTEASTGTTTTTTLDPKKGEVKIDEKDEAKKVDDVSKDPETQANNIEDAKATAMVNHQANQAEQSTDDTAA